MGNSASATTTARPAMAAPRDSRVPTRIRHTGADAFSLSPLAVMGMLSTVMVASRGTVRAVAPSAPRGT